MTAAALCCLLSQRKETDSAKKRGMSLYASHSHCDSGLMAVLGHSRRRFCCLQPQIAAVYNLNNNTWQYFPMTDSPFCSGHIQLINDKVLVVGGDNVNLDADFTDGRSDLATSRAADPKSQLLLYYLKYYTLNPEAP